VRLRLKVKEIDIDITLHPYEKTC